MAEEKSVTTNYFLFCTKIKGQTRMQAYQVKVDEEQVLFTAQPVLVGGFNQVDKSKKNIWSHHLVMVCYNPYITG